MFGKYVKKLYLSSVEGTNRRGRPLGRREDGVKEYLSETGVRGNGLECIQNTFLSLFGLVSRYVS